MSIMDWALILSLSSAGVFSVSVGISGVLTDAPHNAALILPRYMQPNSESSIGTKIFLSASVASILCFLLSLFFLYSYWPLLGLIAYALAILLTSSLFSRFWVRKNKCRPMIPFYLFSLVMLISLALTLIT